SGLGRGGRGPAPVRRRGRLRRPVPPARRGGHPMTAANAVVAAVQATPVFLDRDATVDRACELTARAAAAGASLVVFPEAFVPGYPDWVWRAPAWSDGELTGRLLANAVEVPSPATGRLGRRPPRRACTWRSASTRPTA